MVVLTDLTHTRSRHEAPDHLCFFLCQGFLYYMYDPMYDARYTMVVSFTGRTTS